MFKNAVSYCSQCTSTLFWDADHKPWMIKSGSEKEKACKESGCTLVITNIAEGGCNYENYSLIRMALMESGLSEINTDIALEALSVGHEAKAA